jgi:hypothetical protein
MAARLQTEREKMQKNAAPTVDEHRNTESIDFDELQRDGT